MSETENKSTAESTAVLEGFDTDTDGDEDIHVCKKCRLMFTSLEEYLQHKVRHDNYKVTFSRSVKDRRRVIPKLVQKEKVPARNYESGEEKTKDGEEKENKKERKRRRKKVVQEVNQDLMITERPSYWCPKCNIKFNREATLRRHVEYIHDNSGDYTNTVEDDEDMKADETVADTGDHDEEYEVETEQTQDLREIVSRRISSEDTADRLWGCQVCGNRFKEINVLKAHMLTHSSKRDFPCRVDGCSYAFKTKGSLKRHMRRHTGERPYSCDSCGRSFTESGALTRHLKSRVPCTNKSDNDLPRYGKRWTFTQQTHNKHGGTLVVKSNSDVQVLEAAQTTTVDGTDGTDQTSLQAVIEENQATTAEGEIIDNNNVMIVMVSEGDEDVPIIETEQDQIVGDLTEVETLDEVGILSTTQCKLCRNDFPTVEVLRIHLRTHLADIPFRCGLCHYVAEKREDLSSHMISLHQEDLKGSGLLSQLPITSWADQMEDKEQNSRNAKIAVKQLLELQTDSEGQDREPGISGSKQSYRCPVCGRTFRGNSYLRLHMKAHTGERPHKCRECNKSFLTKDTLTKHLSVHSEDRHYKCGECGKLFKRISHVREHFKIHSNDRPFPCTVCNKSFKTNNAMKVHMRTHSEILPYDCQFCDRRFREKGSMLRHRRMHTGERPFKCKHCQRTFAEHGTLARHLKAKVPCTRQLQLERQEKLDETSYPTVLAEFSSVVADTQQYIMAEDLQQNAEEQQQATEYVVVQTDIEDGENVHNVEIITDGEVDPAFLEGVQVTDDYVVVTDAEENMKILDSRTGETIAMMPLSSITDSDNQMVAMATDNQIEAVAMAPVEMSDSLQAAMLAANVVEEQVETTDVS